MTIKRNNSCVLAAMKQAEAQMTRDEFLTWFYPGDVPETIHPEEECEFREQFQRQALDALLTDKIQ